MPSFENSLIRKFTLATMVLVVTLPAGAEMRIISPRSTQMTTTGEFVNVVGKSDVESSVTVAGETAATFATGVFVRDKLPLQLGQNEIEITVTSAEGGAETTSIVVTREVPAPPKAPSPTDPLKIEARSLVPAAECITRAGEPLEVGFTGTPGGRAEVEFGSGRTYQLSEILDETTPTGVYRATVIPAQKETSAPLTFRLKTGSNGRRGQRSVEVSTDYRVEVWDHSAIRIGKTLYDNGQVSYGIHEVRLGGPYLAELSSGTVVRVTGKRGGYYRLHLTPNLEGWIDADDVATVGAPPVMPRLAFTNISVMGDENKDTITIPYTERVPFSVTPTFGPGGNARLDIDFYGSHVAATWISHRPSAKVIREASVEQVGTEHVRVHADLRQKQLWGYKVDVTTASVVVSVRRPPAIATGGDSPVKGLTIAVEAGHGGPRDNGAGGVSGSREKDINRMTTDALIDALTSAGAIVVNVRVGDEGISLPRKAARAMDANADIYIAIHANSASTERGYLRVSGTSTYYKYAFSFDLSDKIHVRLLENLNIGDFGNVGNFNYYPLRALTWMPGMLVEQAFMSNPEDEAKMLDPAFRAKIALSVVQGLEDFLTSREK